MKNLVIIFFFFYYAISLSAQITVVDKNYTVTKTIKVEPNVELYDSLSPIKLYSWNSENYFRNKKYIGQKLFIPSNIDDPHLFSLYTTKYPLNISIYKNQISDKIYSEVWTNVYKPKEREKTSSEDYLKIDFIKHSSSDSVRNKYYTITDIIYLGSQSKSVKAQKLINVIWKPLIPDSVTYDRPCYYYQYRNDVFSTTPDVIMIELRDDISGDTLYIDGVGGLISVGFFSKVKKLYEGKKFVWYSNGHGLRDFITHVEFKEDEIGVKFKCSAINIFENSIVTILENEKGKISQNILNLKSRNSHDVPNKYSELMGTMSYDVDWLNLSAYNMDRGLFLEDDIAKLDIKLAEKIRKNQIDKRKYENTSNLNINRHLQNCIQKYGKVKGTLVAQGEVVIGMTKAMCHDAWASNPLCKIIKTETEYGTTEIWTNGYSKKLYLVNGIVKKIIKY